MRFLRGRTWLVAFSASSALHSMALGVALLGSGRSAATLNHSTRTTMDAPVPKWKNKSAEVPVTVLAEEDAVRVTRHEDKSDLSRLPLGELEGPVANASLQQLARKRLEEETKRSESLDPEQQFQKLQAASKRLSQLSSDKSVGEMSGQLRKVLDLPERATQPMADAAETDGFDPESAQLHDVLKEVSDDGHDQYMAVLLDAQGRTSKLPLSEDEGKKLHRLMKLIKSNPLLERVYRELAMPLLDQLLGKSPSDKPETTKSPKE